MESPKEESPTQHLIEEKKEDVASEAEKKIPIWKILLLTISFLGVQFGWALQVAYVTPLLLELGVSKSFVSYVWIAGPVSGLVVQPLVGFFSDRSTSRFGRRRPFIAVGAICIAFGLALISNAEFIGEKLGDTPDNKIRGIVLAVIGIWVLDLSNNTVQGPCRALLVDVAPPSQQNIGGSCFSIMLGVGNLLGYYIGSVSFVKYVPFMGTDLRLHFTIGIIVMLVCVFTTVFTVKEIPFKPVSDGYEKLQSDEKHPSVILESPETEAKSLPQPIDRWANNPFVAIARGIVRMPPAMKRVCAVQFFAWFAWFNFLIYITNWVGENIYHGDPDAPIGSIERSNYDAGVRAGSLGLSIYSVVTVVASFLIPPLSKLIGLKFVFFIAQISLVIMMICTIWVHDSIGAIIMIAGFGVPWSAVMVLPFTLVALSVDEKDSGLYMGVLNIFVCVPQILVAVGIGFIVEAFHGNVIAGFVCGGISAFVSAVLCLFLVVNKERTVFVVGGGH